MVCLAHFPTRAANLTPIAVNGFNRDVVLEKTAVGPPFTAAAELNPGEGTAFYEKGLPQKQFGLPVGSFTSAFDGSTVFQFQPFTNKNALVLSSETGLSSGTLTLATPVQYQKIAVIANSASGGGTPQLVLHFAGGSSITASYNAQDWFLNPGFALQGVDRIYLNNGLTEGGPSDPRFYQTTIDLAAALGTNNKPLVSLTFSKAAGVGATAIYAISGFPTSAVGVASITNIEATNVEAQSATITGFVSDTGGDAPNITIYYGTANGGTNSTAWDARVNLRKQTGSFSQQLTNLAQNTSYFVAVQAVNLAGTVWASSSDRFSTTVLKLPQVQLVPAIDIESSQATITGQVLDAGGDIPNVNLYYGTFDAGTNASAWTYMIPLGFQAAGFAQPVTALTANTTYFATAEAINAAGKIWTDSIQFTTWPTNAATMFAAVLTHHNDNARTGANLDEHILTAKNVNTNQFGLVFSRSVDDQVYAQPLVMTNVSIPGRGTRNLLIVATVNDSVYGFDADDASLSVPYWHASLLGSNAVAPRNSDMTGACGGFYQDFSGKIGIVGTPVIDSSTGTMYVVARTKESNGSFVQRLHALDLANGLEMSNSPVAIVATYRGNGAGSLNNTIMFDSQRQNQRPGLALVNGVVYIGWSSHCDWGPYHGWVIGYDAATLKQVVVFNNTPNGYNGGIWMSGQAPAADDSGNLYLSVGNGTVGDGGDLGSVVNRGESFLKLSRAGSALNVSSWFTPYNWQELENGDVDLGSGGLLLIPGTKLAFSGGKQGVVYLVNRDKMGGLSSGNADTNIVQTFQVTPDEVHGGPVWWDGPDGSYSYIWPASVNLQQYEFDWSMQKFTLPAYAQGQPTAPVGQPGGILSLSANHTNANTAILWASHQLSGDANQSVRPGILRAYNAQNVGQELWNSEQIRTRDSVGNFAKFVPPRVANGKVYLATFSGRVNVYGLMPPPRLTVGTSSRAIDLSWPAIGPIPDVLQAKTNLTLGDWLDVTNSIRQTNGTFRVTTPITEGSMFYRLKH